MVSQTQRLRQQQRELRGGDLKGLSKTESLRLQQESLTTGVPKRRLLAIRDYKERMRKAEASPEVREFKNLLVNQNTYLNSLEKQLADAISQRAAKRAERDIPDLRRSLRRRLSYETKMLDTQIQALQKVIPNVKKVILRIANFSKRAVTAVFVGKPELAIEMVNNLRTLANEIQSNSNQYVSAKVKNRGRRLRHNRRMRKRRDRRREALKDLRLAGVDINLLKLGKVSISTEQAERLSTSTQRFLKLDLGKSTTFKKYKPYTTSTGEVLYGTSTMGGVEWAFVKPYSKKPPLRDFLADLRKPSKFEQVTGVDLLTIKDTRMSVSKNPFAGMPPPWQFKKDKFQKDVGTLYDWNKQQQNIRQDALNILKGGKDTKEETSFGMLMGGIPTVKSISPADTTYKGIPPPNIAQNIAGLLVTGTRYVEDMIGGIPEVVMKAEKDLGIDSFVAAKPETDTVLTGGIWGDTILLRTPKPDIGWKPTDFYGQGTWVKDAPQFDLTKVTLEDLTKMKKFELVGQIEEERFAKQSEKEAVNIINLAVLKLEKDALSGISNKIERKKETLIKLVEIGIITPEVANKQLEKLAKELEVKEQVNLKKKVDKIVERENKKFKDITTAEFKRIRSETNKDIDRRDALGIGVRTAIVTGIFGAALYPISIVAAPLAVGIGAGVSVSTFIGSGGITGIQESYAERPLTTMASLGGSVVGGAVVGGAVFGKTKISARKMHLALDRATNIPKYVGIKGKVNIEKIMAKYKITKAEVKGLLLDMEMNSNLKLTKITTELKAGKGMNELADAKILPKVLAEYLEVLDESSGTVVKRYTRGSVIAEQKGKTFAREVLERAVGLVEEGRVDFIGRTLIAKPDIMKGWKSIEARNILEKTKMTGKKKIGDWTFITSETDIYMLGKTTSQARPVQKRLRKEMFDITKTAEAGNILDIFIDTPGKIKKLGVGTDITATIELGPKSAIPFGITAFKKVAVPDITKFIKIKGKGKFDLEVGSGTGFKEFVKPKKIRDPDGGIKPPWDKSDIMNWRGTNVERIRQLKDFGVKLEYFTEPSKLIPKPSRAFSKAIKKVNQKDVALDALTKPIKKLKQKDIPGTSRSSYAGKGMYEITEGGIMPPSGTSKMSQVRTSARLDFLTKDITRTIINQDMTRGVFKKAFMTTTAPALSTSSRYSQVMQSDTELEKKLLGTTTIFKSPQAFGFKERVIQKPKVAQLSLVQPQILQLTQLTGTTTFVPPRLPPPKIPKIIPPFLFPKSRYGMRKPKVDKRPYNVFIKGRKIGMNLSKPTAKNFGAYVVDNSIAAQFKIKPTRGKIKAPRFKVPPSFFNLNVGKFRKPRGKKPKRNIYIERKNRRLDTANEVNEITAARFVSSQRKLANAGKVNIFGKI